ncbi:MAG: hypothetical protein HY862_07290 [Chloroflexi bacterium]|nr:hypothetical protein [Chloroflexota bacterium]
MDNEFAGSVSPEMARVKAAAKAFFDSMELYMGTIQQIEDEIKRLQGESDDPHQEGPHQQGGNLDDICEDLDPIECLQGLNIELTTEGSATWTDEQIQVVYDSIKAQYNAIAQVGGSFIDFFPKITIILSDDPSEFAALTTEDSNKNVILRTGTAGEITITIWGSGNVPWPSEPNGTPVFSPELITHEFGHALNYGYGQNLLNTLFTDPYLGNPSAANQGTQAVWLPFPAGSHDDDPRTFDVRIYGRMYGNRWNNTDEQTAEAYAVWVYSFYTLENLDVIDSSSQATICDMIQRQQAFWDAIFSGRIDLTEINYKDYDVNDPEYIRRYENWNKALAEATNILTTPQLNTNCK